MQRKYADSFDRYTLGYYWCINWGRYSVIPLRTNELLDMIMNEHGFSIETIARRMNVSRRSIYRVLNGEKPSGKLVVALIRLHLQLTTEQILPSSSG
jgi:DNA-binding XRE family transcriptional regulator